VADSARFLRSITCCTGGMPQRPHGTTSHVGFHAAALPAGTR
jgi:hypothetical protein